METQKDDQLLTPEEVAVRLRKIVGTVYENIQAGEFPNVRMIRHSYLIPKSDVDACLERHTKKVFVIG